jgi:hypothetical protein
MKKQAIILMLLLASLVLWRCGSKADYDVPGQESLFRDFMVKNNFTYNASLAERYGLYRNLYDHDSLSRIFADNGDTVSIRYSGYLFNSSARYGLGNIFTSNIESDWPVMPNTMMPMLPVWFIPGTGQTLRGIELGVTGCAPGDSLRLYLTSDLAYGNRSVGLLPPGTPVVFKICIDDIRKCTDR